MTEKLLLINPPSPFLADEKVFPSLGMGYVLSALEKIGHNVDYIDMAGKNERDINSQLDGIGRYHTVGLTATSPQFSNAYRILERIKSNDSSQRVVIGGSHAAMVSALRRKKLSEGMLEMSLYGYDPNFAPLEKFDAIVDGEAEANPQMILDGKGWVTTGINSQMDSTPFPDREVLGLENYAYSIDGQNATSIITQRGCPFKCLFCSGRDSDMYRNVRFGGSFRGYSPGKLLDEMDSINERWGISAFMIYDDEFNLLPERTLEICEALEDRDYTLRGFVKSELWVKRPDVAEAMKKAGFVELLTGVESGSERILKDWVRKNTTPKINLEARNLAKDLGIRFKALTMVGHPDETEEDAMKTLEWILEAKPDDFDVTIHQPYPGSPIYNGMKPTGKMPGFEFSFEDVLFFNKIDYSKETAFYKGVPGEYKSFIRTRDLSPEDFVRLRDKIDNVARKELGLETITRKQHEHTMGQGSITTKK